MRLKEKIFVLMDLRLCISRGNRCSDVLGLSSLIAFDC
ncbi:hypothetical protein SynMEDNS5_01943 [Synechococcus sp. MEDNS5]|nr:hypothetical protein SynMEDNS5_01943 [Synechococcus sp. MEDNS5]